MRIELKKIEINERLSDETCCFSADLYINGRNVGIAYNRGNGCPTDYYATTPEGKEQILKAEDYCKTLPPIKSGEHTYEMDLEFYIDNLLNSHVKQQSQKKMQKRFKDHIVIGNDRDVGYRYVNIQTPIEATLKSESGRAYIKTVLETLKEQLESGDQVLNDNIPTNIFKAAGFGENQYLDNDLQLATKARKQSKSIGKKM
ncbi:hypothetical protein FXV77_05515 [Sphingobacterium phlebotomi]|uniref:Uncharacterized protein n=1 Tax=Sphingobacterium phlebotomi TaxID=2605433 RepID=A0A5D4HB88_9SPHI|nr:hypothetical protein [Sphingobacterium phlebotomi]TYR37463.1 hypothetical protein FXV77_05515 [Sphingobacterium phlebotomi]